jgi:hypothetical protein
MKEFHLFLYDPVYDIIHHGYYATLWCIEEGFEKISTTQVILCTTKLFELGYRIFVHDLKGIYEIKLGKNDCTNREIKMSHNLPKLILNGEFRQENLQWDWY